MHLPVLRFPPFTPRFARDERGITIYDEVRRIWVVLTPEEWVRQSLLHHMHRDLSYPWGRMSLEYPVRVQGMPQRADIVVLGQDRKPFLLVECKAAHVPLDRAVLEQVARYNAQLKAEYFAATNGLSLVVFARTSKGYEARGEALPTWG